MEESDVSVRKHRATDKTLPLSSVRSLVDVVGSQYRQTERKTKRDEHGLCKLVGSSSRKLCSVHWSVRQFVLFVCSSSALATASFF